MGDQDVRANPMATAGWEGLAFEWLEEMTIYKGVISLEILPATPDSRRQPVNPGTDPLVGFTRKREKSCLGIEHLHPSLEIIQVELHVGQQIGFVQDQRVDAPIDIRILVRLIVPLGNTGNQDIRVRAEAKRGRTDQVTNVLDDQQSDLVQRQAGEGITDHDRIQVAIAASVDLYDRHRRPR